MKYFMASIQALLLLCVAKHSWGQTTDFEANWPSLEKHQAVPEWFADAKFGIYFHYGIYSVPGWGGEWYPRWMYVNNRVGWGEKIYQYHQDTYGKNFQYHDFIPMWKADKFDAASWVDLFADSGAKIIGSIAEHHDGFSLWESKANPWNAKDMGPKIDIVRAIQQETKKKGLKFMTTFHHGFHMNFYPHKTASVDRPDRELLLESDTIFPSQDPKYRLLYGNIGYAEANNFWINKLNEVIDGYSPDFIWMDFGQRYIKETYRQQFLANYFNHAQRQGKEVLVNTKGDFFPKSLAIVNVERATMQDITPNVWITDFILGGAWSYDKERRIAIKPEKAIRMLVEVVSKNGVMLLSAGPMPDGTIPTEQVEALHGIGAWLKKYGEAVYGTRPFVSFGEGPTKLTVDTSDEWNEYGAVKKGLDLLNFKDIRYTQKGKVIYCTQLGWNDQDTSIVLTTFGDKAKKLKVQKVSMLGSSEKITWTRQADGLKINLPRNKPELGEMATVFKIEVE